MLLTITSANGVLLMVLTRMTLNSKIRGFSDFLRFSAAKERTATKQVEIDQDYLRTGTAIDSGAFHEHWLIFSVRPKTIVFGRTSVLLCFFSFFSPRNLRAPSADRREILRDAWCCVQFYNPGPKFWGSLPKKILGAKNMQNLARFRSTSKFGGEYLRNG